MHADSETNSPGSETTNELPETNRPDSETVAEIEGSRLSKLALQPGEIVVYTAPEAMDSRIAQSVGKALHSAFPTHRCIILQPGEKIEIVSDAVLRQLLAASPLKTAASSEEETTAGTRAGSTDNPGSDLGATHADPLVEAVQALARMLGAHMGEVISTVKLTDQKIDHLTDLIEQAALADEEEEAAPRTLDGDLSGAPRESGQSLG